MKILTALPVAVCAALALNGQTPVAAGRAIFENRCSGCHGADGNGGELGPAIARRLTNLSDAQVKTTVLEGLPTRGMPANASRLGYAQLIAFLRSLRPRRLGFQPYRSKVTLTDGATLEGTVVAESFEDAQLRTDDNRLHLLRRVEGGRFREVTSEVNWTTYNGDVGGNRFTTLTQIDRTNVKRVAPRWIFTMPGASGLEVTPIVSDGVMYVTNANECYALDAGSGGRSGIFSVRAPAG